MAYQRSQMAYEHSQAGAVRGLTKPRVAKWDTEERGMSKDDDRTKRVPAKIRLHHLQQAKAAGRKLTMLTSYDALTAHIFDQAGVDMLLVGDSIGNVMLGYPTTLPVTLRDIESATSAVVRGTSRAFVVADLPFGSYQKSPKQAYSSAVKLMKAGAGAVKLEGGAPLTATVKKLVEGGIPVMGHLGYTPQSEHVLGGPRLQGLGPASLRLLSDAQALEEAGAFAIVLEMVPASLAETVSRRLTVPTIGIGAGPQCDGQVLVWSDMAGMTDWSPSFAYRFAELGKALQGAAEEYVETVEDGTFPGPENTRET